MGKRVLFVLVAILMQACAKTWVHEEYPLDPKMIPAFNINGQVTITNAQPSTDKVVVYGSGGNKWTADLHTLTDGVVQQAIEELGKHGHVVNTARPKTIGLKVLSLKSEAAFFHWNSSMHLEAVLGDGETIELSNDHGSGWSVDQDLNGCMAEGVMTLFTNEKVLAYLSQ